MADNRTFLFSKKRTARFLISQKVDFQKMLSNDCDLCGKPAVKEALVEGARVSVCERCARFGKEIRLQRPVFASPSHARVAPIAEYSLADGYGRAISAAREKHGLTREQLAKKLFISEHELERIEGEKLAPREQVARKLELELKIKLVSEIAASESTMATESSLEKMRDHHVSRGKELTLADIVSIKRKQ